MFSTGIPSCSESPFLKPHTFWLDSHTVRRSPFQAQIVVNSSMGLWCCVGVLYIASSFSSALSYASSASPPSGLRDASKRRRPRRLRRRRDRKWRSPSPVVVNSQPMRRLARRTSNVSATTMATIWPSCQILFDAKRRDARAHMTVIEHDLTAFDAFADVAICRNVHNAEDGPRAPVRQSRRYVQERSRL